MIFADVDLTDSEVDLDFAARPAARAGRYGTVGMWCALHGESVLGAGMHHLEGQFSFDELAASLAELGQPSMRPFSDQPYLRQAFTEAEWWPVPADRLAALVAAGHLDSQRAAEIARPARPARTWRTWPAGAASRASTRPTSRSPCGPPTRASTAGEHARPGSAAGQRHAGRPGW